jgi:hypothetical protein
MREKAFVRLRRSGTIPLAHRAGRRTARRLLRRHQRWAPSRSACSACERHWVPGACKHLAASGDVAYFVGVGERHGRVVTTCGLPLRRADPALSADAATALLLVHRNSAGNHNLIGWCTSEKHHARTARRPTNATARSRPTPRPLGVCQTARLGEALLPYRCSARGGAMVVGDEAHARAQGRQSTTKGARINQLNRIILAAVAMLVVGLVAASGSRAVASSPAATVCQVGGSCQSPTSSEFLNGTGEVGPVSFTGQLTDANALANENPSNPVEYTLLAPRGLTVNVTDDSDVPGCNPNSGDGCRGVFAALENETNGTCSTNLFTDTGGPLATMQQTEAGWAGGQLHYQTGSPSQPANGGPYCLLVYPQNEGSFGPTPTMYTLQFLIDEPSSPPSPAPSPAARRCHVPTGVRGAKLGVVRHELVGSGCRVGRIIYLHSGVRRGRVVSLSYPRSARTGTAGALAFGTKVSIAVSRGSRP